MAWNACYWDILDQVYWTPRFTGMRSIGQASWIVEGDRVSVPLADVNLDGPLYARRLKHGAFVEDLHRSEEILNHVFSITAAIAPDAVLNDLFMAPLGFADRGPIECIGRDIWSRYGWKQGDNVTQQDGFFVSERSAVGVELKLEAASSAEQVMKYAALLAWEELACGPRENLGLLYIVPERALGTHWAKCGLTGPSIDRSFMATAWRKPMPPKVLRERVVAIAGSCDQGEPGGQTVHRLLSGFLAQLSAHKGTGLEA